MITRETLHRRLSSLSQKLETKHAALDIREHLHDSHALTAGELRMRHMYLANALNAQVASLEAQHHNISALERDVLNWMNSIDLVMP